MWSRKSQRIVAQKQSKKNVEKTAFFVLFGDAARPELSKVIFQSRENSLSHLESFQAQIAI